MSLITRLTVALATSALLVISTGAQAAGRDPSGSGRPSGAPTPPTDIPALEPSEGALAKANLSLPAGTQRWAAPGLILRNSWVNWPTVFSDPSMTTLLANTDVFSFFIDTVYQNPGKFLNKAVLKLRTARVAVAVEAGGLLDYVGCGPKIGANSAALELKKIKPIYDAGGSVTYLSLDDPILRVIAGGAPNNCGFTLDQSIDQLIIYMKAIHRKYPGIKIGYITSFSSWQYGSDPVYWGPDKNFGDFAVAFARLMTRLPKSNEKIAYVHADNPYDYYIGEASSNTGFDPQTVDWASRLKAFQAQVESYGLRFGLMYNSEIGGNTSNALFAADTLAFINLYNSSGKRPVDYMVESWYTYPDTIASFASTFVGGTSIFANPVAATEQPVYRLLRANTYDHIYTTSVTERDALVSSLEATLEVVAFQTFVNAVPGTLPLLRLTNPTSKLNAYTISTAEQAALKTQGFVDNGTIGSCYPAESRPSNAVPLYRLLNNVSGDNFYTVGEEERQAVLDYGDHTDLGITCYVPR